MEKVHPLFNFDLNQFANLQEAFIDASSMIYALKAGFFRELQDTLTLYTLPEIAHEVGFEGSNIHVIQCHQEELNNDQKLVYCAIERKLPVISEDKQILMKMKKANLPYYNALIMLNWLLFTKKIDQEKYSQCYSSLREIARYSKKVWEYGNRVHSLIIHERDKAN